LIKRETDLIKEVLVKKRPSLPFDVQYTEFEENPILFRQLESNTKLIILERTSIKRLCGMVVYKVEKSKVDILLAFFLTFILSR